MGCEGLRQSEGPRNKDGASNFSKYDVMDWIWSHVCTAFVDILLFRTVNILLSRKLASATVWFYTNNCRANISIHCCQSLCHVQFKCQIYFSLFLCSPESLLYHKITFCTFPFANPPFPFDFHQYGNRDVSLTVRGFYFSA